MKNKLLSILQLIILIVTIGIPVYIVIFYPEIVMNFSSIDAFMEFMDRYEEWSILIYIGFQIIQVIITVIPGQIIQIAGGYIYGFFIAMLLSVIGILIGSTLAFFIARKIGQCPIVILFGEQKFLRYKEIFDTKRAHWIMFILYLVPGLPKDMIAYAAGVSQMRIVVFLIISMMGRLPSIVVSLLVGIMLENNEYTGTFILAAAATGVCLICILKRKRIFAITDKYYYKFNKRERWKKHRQGALVNKKCTRIFEK